ncbi:hypothetical protein [Actinobacillus vicugnae]|uniref:hypothetical protein n=1 Tax=Actinobacillus vicugnae TaxID=2573093 RepID=UPI001AD6E90E|nr:hypothetical protein [Actinobacillus vicugnae]
MTILIQVELVQHLASACRLLSGKVDTSDNEFLDDYDVELGYFLMDTTYPLSDCVIRAFAEEEITHSLSNGSRGKRDFGSIKKE